MLPEPTKLQLMQSLALFYCYTVFSNSITKGEIDRIRKLQNSDVRFIFKYLALQSCVQPQRTNQWRTNLLNMLLIEDMCRMLTTSVINKVIFLSEPHYLNQRRFKTSLDINRLCLNPHDSMEVASAWISPLLRATLSQGRKESGKENSLIF